MGKLERYVEVLKMDKLTIEKTEDIEGLWDLFLLADPSREMVQKYLPFSDIYIAKRDDKVAGVLVLCKVSQKIYEIKNIAVAPDLQRKGIGYNLLLHAKSVLTDCKGYELRICTGNTSTHQISLYKKAGFSIASIEVGYFIRNYPEPIYENGSRCEDLVILRQMIS